MPLDEVKNSYSCMNGELKKVLKTSIHVMGKKYGLNEITYPSFYRVKKKKTIYCELIFFS